MKLNNTYGNNCRAVALSTVLGYYGYPFSESMCFGLCGAYDFVVSEIEFGLNKSYTVVSGNSENDFINISNLLDIDLCMYQFSNESNLKDFIFRNIFNNVPLIARVSINKYMKELHQTPTNDNEHAMQIFKLIHSSAGNHVTVINNIGTDKISIYEPNLFDPVLVSWKNFYLAMCPNNRTVHHPARTIYTLKPKVSFERIQSNMNFYIISAIKDNMLTYLHGSSEWSGIRNIKTLDKMLFQDISKKKRQGNAKIFRFFCDITTGGGFYRRVYANFLKEANRDYLKDELIDSIAKDFNKCCRDWSSIAKNITNNCNNLSDAVVEQFSASIYAMYIQEQENAEKLLERVKNVERRIC